MTGSEGPLSLTDFAAKLRPKKACRVCELAEAGEINRARQAGVAYKTIERWLVEECGYPEGYVSDHRVQVHFDKGHDE